MRERSSRKRIAEARFLRANGLAQRLPIRFRAAGGSASVGRVQPRREPRTTLRKRLFSTLSLCHERKSRNQRYRLCGFQEIAIMHRDLRRKA